MAHNLSLSEQLLYSTTRIEAEHTDGDSSLGTGFFFRFPLGPDRSAPVIVTNKHVIDRAARLRFLIHEADGNAGPVPTRSLRLELNNFDLHWIRHPDDDVDVCMLPLAPLLTEASRRGKTVFYITLDPSLIPTHEFLEGLGGLEDVTMIGYPIGIWDSTNNMPVARRGITATHPCLEYEGRSEFMIDVACFPGSSGSPVFLHNEGSYPNKTGGVVMGSRLKLLGLLYAGPMYDATGEVSIETIPTHKTLITTASIPTNLGLVVKARRILELEPLLRAAAIRKPATTSA